MSATPPDSNPSSAKTAIGNLTATLRADYAALQNDLEQAQELAADFQRQLAGKSNEVAHFKALLEKTQQDLIRMEGHVGELRQERHRLANQAMQTTGQNAEMEEIKRERDHFRKEVETLRTALTKSCAEAETKIQQQDKELTRLRAAFEMIRAKAIATSGAVAAPKTSTDAGVNERIAELTATVQRLESLIQQAPPAMPTASPAKLASSKAGKVLDDRFIDISFTE